MSSISSNYLIFRQDFTDDFLAPPPIYPPVIPHEESLVLADDVPLTKKALEPLFDIADVPVAEEPYEMKSLLCAEEIEPEKSKNNKTSTSTEDRTDDETLKLIHTLSQPLTVKKTKDISPLHCPEEINRLSPLDASKKLYECIHLGQIEKIQYLVSSYPQILSPPFHRNGAGVPILVYSLKEKQIEAASSLLEALKNRPALLMDRGALSRSSITVLDITEHAAPCALDLTRELNLDTLSNSIFYELKKYPNEFVDSISSIEFSHDRKQTIKAYLSAVKDMKDTPDCSAAFGALILRLAKKNAVQDCKLLLQKGLIYISSKTLWELLANLIELRKTAKCIYGLVEKAIKRKNIYHDNGAAQFYRFLKNEAHSSAVMYYKLSRDHKALQKQIRESYKREITDTSGVADLSIWKKIANTRQGAQKSGPCLLKCLKNEPSLLSITDKNGNTVFDIDRVAKYKILRS